jgi:fumarate reductase flavoprotein subunit
LKILEDNALKNGADIRYQINALQLIRKEDGRVSGLIAKDNDGNYIQFNADKGVILCTGDYGSNPEMMEKYCPWAADVAKKHNIYFPPLNTGDGHKMALKVGAVMELPPHAPMDHVIGLWLPMGMNAFLRVNIRGERYENEDVPGQSMANSLFRQPEWKLWQVFDAKWPEEVPNMGIGLSKIIVGDETQQKELQKKIEQGMCLQADTIEELATKMKVPEETFKKTIARYNELARAGKDLDFGKRADRLTTVEKPPFYAGSANPTFLVVLGGMNVNPDHQALDADGKVIPGLYLAGNTAGGFFANDYPTMVAGISHGRALTFGFIAGKNAASETL